MVMPTQTTFAMQVMQAVCNQFGCTEEDIRAKKRVPYLFKARCCYYWTLNHAMSMEEIARQSNRKSSSSIHNAICEFLRASRKDTEYRQKCQQVLMEVGGPTMIQRFLP